ncbi:hypothetical protein GCM10009107_59770 [Ideonella azotifigens]|uniref:Secreted protein n=1 Tax=Ideonella azotifigens TaxID=513160 RepID=A0ABN1KK29_9BURK
MNTACASIGAGSSAAVAAAANSSNELQAITTDIRRRQVRTGCALGWELLIRSFRVWAHRQRRAVFGAEFSHALS